MKAHAEGADDLDVAHAVLEHLADLGPLEAELHVVRRERITVVELQSLAQLEVVDALVRAHRPRLREARRHEVAGHRLHERVVHRVEHPERCQEAAGDLARIEPRRRQRHVERPAHLTLRLGRPRLRHGLAAERATTIKRAITSRFIVCVLPGTRPSSHDYSRPTLSTWSFASPVVMTGTMWIWPSTSIRQVRSPACEIAWRSRSCWAASPRPSGT